MKMVQVFTGLFPGFCLVEVVDPSCRLFDNDAVLISKPSVLADQHEQYCGERAIYVELAHLVTAGT